MAQETFTNNNEGAITVGTVSTVVLPSNSARKYLAICNDSDEIIYLSLDGTAELNQGIRISASGGSFVLDSTDMYIGAITAICSSGGKNLTFSEV